MNKAKLILSLLLCSVCSAQQLPDAPSHKLLVVAAVASIGVDAWGTNRNSSGRFCHEHNPIARPFVDHGTPLLAAYFAAGAATVYFADRSLTKHHRKAAIAFDLAVIGAESYCIHFSVSHHK